MCVDQLVTCTWMHDPANGYNDTMVWLPEEVQICTGIMLLYGIILYKEMRYKDFFGASAVSIFEKSASKNNII